MTFVFKQTFSLSKANTNNGPLENWTQMDIMCNFYEDGHEMDTIVDISYFFLCYINMSKLPTVIEFNL